MLTLGHGYATDNRQPFIYSHPTQLAEAVRTGKIYVAMTGGRWWRIRPNGQLKLWKRDPKRFRLPWKAGLYVYGALTEADIIDAPISDDDWQAEARQLARMAGDLEA